MHPGTCKSEAEKGMMHSKATFGASHWNIEIGNSGERHDAPEAQSLFDLFTMAPFLTIPVWKLMILTFRDHTIQLYPPFGRFPHLTLRIWWRGRERAWWLEWDLSGWGSGKSSNYFEIGSEVRWLSLLMWGFEEEAERSVYYSSRSGMRLWYPGWWGAHCESTNAPLVLSHTR